MRGTVLNKAVLKVKSAKNRINNVTTIERKKLFKSKIDACKVDLKVTYKIVNQLLNKAHCNNFPSHTNEKTLASSFNFLHK